jgi:CRISPR/Cas system-associated exonuclease Cas4 (RecB family)
MGTAFHKALEFLSRHRHAAVDGAIAVFRDSLKRERLEAEENFREQQLVWPRDLREAMEVVLASRAVSPGARLDSRSVHHVETNLNSSDGLLTGRPDEVVRTPDGIVIIDYKSGGFDEARLPDFHDQLHFYAALWQEVYRELPAIGRVVFLLANQHSEVAIDESRCRTVIEEARSFARSLDSIAWASAATIGPHCGLCAYRPWCDTYWRSLSDETSLVESDLEATLCGQHPRDGKVFCVVGRNGHTTVVNRAGAVPDWEAGTPLRLLGLEGEGQVLLRQRWSEVFRIVRKSS